MLDIVHDHIYVTLLWSDLMIACTNILATQECALYTKMTSNDILLVCFTHLKTV